MEKTSEQRQHMYIVFVDFIKAFDTVNREFLFKILGKHQTRRSLINPSQCLSIS